MSAWNKPILPKLRPVLFPLALLYWGILFWRNLFYVMGFFVSRKLPTKVISVGNITTGGTGKTPAVIYLAKTLSNRGYRVGVLSRGYARKTAGTQLVSDGKTPVLDWRNFGDEPTLIANSLSGVPIVVDGNRHRGGMFLIDRFKPDIIIMDDAFQHRAIERDIDIVLINSQDSRSKHKLLPYGFLREPWAGLKRAHVLIFTKTNLKKPAPFLMSMARATKRPMIQSILSVHNLISPEGDAGQTKEGQKAIALSAVGDPEGFIRTLESEGFNVVEHIAFIDHHEYVQADINRIARRLNKTAAEIIITTEKDMVKLQGLNLSRLKIYSLRVAFSLSKNAEQKLLSIITG